MNSNAVMLRRDGVAFDVPFHPYGEFDKPNTVEVDAVLMYCDWLYNHTKSVQTQQKIIKLMEAVIFENEYFDVYDMVDDIDPSAFSDEFLRTIDNKIDYDATPDTDSQTLAIAINKDLNQQFLRARFGGRYDSDNISLGEMVFRVSSTGFNWIDKIYAFVAENPQIKLITIVKDLTSTGSEKVYKYKNEEFWMMPRDTFLSMEGNPVIEGLKRQYGRKSLGNN